MAESPTESPAKHDFTQSPDYKDVQPSHNLSRDGEFQAEDVGELPFEECTQGGLGRHLGLFSTTFLMSVLSLRQDYCLLTGNHYSFLYLPSLIMHGTCANLW
jgi:hypothetical protein